MSGIKTVPPEKDTLPILLNGACGVDTIGEMCSFPDNLRPPYAVLLGGALLFSVEKAR